MSNTEKYRSIIALHQVNGIGAKNLTTLLSYFEKPSDVFSADRRVLRSLGLSEATIQGVAEVDWHAVDHAQKWLEQPLNNLVLVSDTDYPQRLREISDPPPLLFVRGSKSILNSEQIAIVGSRNVTPGGAQIAKEFGQQLSANGIVVNSGLAYGVDAAAHEGALQGVAGTIAVLGTGIDRIYPVKHHSLAEKIVENGALISEFPLTTAPIQRNFPRRNRIISGMSFGVLVVEAALQSGSLITARHALEQGREVFAIPGSIYNPQSKGCHELIRHGAKLVETLEDILIEISPMLKGLSFSKNLTEPDPIPIIEELVEENHELLKFFGYEPVTVDILVARSGLTAETVCSMLMLLELQGYVRPHVGGTYIRQGN